MSEFAEKIKTINVGRADRASMRKTTVDVHDHHTVEVTEHYADRQDVTVKPQTLRIKGPKVAHG